MAGGAQNRFDHRGGASLALGAGDVNDPRAAMGVVHALKQTTDVAQVVDALLAGQGGCAAFVVNERQEPGDGILVVHGSS